MSSDSIRPNWDCLSEIAAGQAGYFTTKQAQEAGYFTHLLGQHTHAGRVARSRRGIYRLVHFPAGEHEDLVAAWPLRRSSRRSLVHRFGTDHQPATHAQRLRARRPLARAATDSSLQAFRRGLVSKADLGDVETALEPFGGLVA